MVQWEKNMKEKNSKVFFQWKEEGDGEGDGGGGEEGEREEKRNQLENTVLLSFNIEPSLVFLSFSCSSLQLRI